MSKRRDGEEIQGVAPTHDTRARKNQLQQLAARCRPVPHSNSSGSAHELQKQLKALASEYADVSKPDGVRSSHALDLLADILADEDKQKAGEALDLLAITYDPVRKNYWEYRKGLLGLPAAAAA